MPIIVSGGDSKSYTPAPEGTHQAVCVDVIDVGMKDNPFKPGTQQHKIDIAWQINELREDGKRFTVYKRYTASLNDKATLRHDLEAWRGKAFGFDELASFDVEKLIGANCLINVQHRKSQDGAKTYANVMSIAPLIKNMPKIAPADYVRKTDAQRADSVPPPNDEDAVSVPDFAQEDAVPF